MLKLEIVDDTCGENEAHFFEVPLDTNWMDIQLAIKMFFPTCSEVRIAVVEEENG